MLPGCTPRQLHTTPSKAPPSLHFLTTPTSDPVWGLLIGSLPLCFGCLFVPFWLFGIRSQHAVGELVSDNRVYSKQKSLSPLDRLNTWLKITAPLVSCLTSLCN